MNESCVIGYVDGGDVNHFFMLGLADVLLEDGRRGPTRSRICHNGGIAAELSGPRIAAARNNVVKAFLKTEAKWLLMVDTDMVFTHAHVNKIFQHAHPGTAPIVGGLCFGGGRSGVIFPTLYVLRQATEENPDPVQIVEEYPEDALCKVDATGAAFLLMHRDAIEKIGAEFGEPYPWFAEGTVYRGIPFGEDWAFCMRAKHLGIPVHVHTGVKIGHVKPQILDESAWHDYKAVRDEIGEDGILAAHRRRVGADG